MKKLLRIDLLFVVYGLLFLILGLGYFHSRYFGTLDINVHDTYFITTYSHFTVMLSVPFFLLSAIYFLFHLLKRPLQKTLGFIHFVITDVTIPVLLISTTLFPTSEPPRRYYVNDSSVFEFHFFDINSLVLITFFSFIIGQLILLVNILLSVLRKKKIN